MAPLELVSEAERPHLLRRSGRCRQGEQVVREAHVSDGVLLGALELGRRCSCGRDRREDEEGEGGEERVDRGEDPDEAHDDLEEEQPLAGAAGEDLPVLLEEVELALVRRVLELLDAARRADHLGHATGEVEADAIGEADPLYRHEDACGPHQAVEDADDDGRPGHQAAVTFDEAVDEDLECQRIGERGDGADERQRQRQRHLPRCRREPEDGHERRPPPERHGRPDGVLSHGPPPRATGAQRALATSRPATGAGGCGVEARGLQREERGSTCPGGR